MSTAPGSASSQPTLHDLDELRRLAVAGRILDAYERTKAFAPLDEWADPRAARTAAWLCDDLGAPQRGRRIALRAYRRAPRSSAGQILRLYATLKMRGPRATWNALSSAPRDPTATDREEGAEWRLLEALVLASFRDFERAMSAVEEAERAGATPRRTELCRAHVLWSCDRYADALECIERAAKVAPDSPDVISAMAHTRVLLGDAEEALSILRDGATRTQSPDLAMQLVGRLDERRLYTERREWIETWAARVPLLENLDLLRGLRADAAYDHGDFEAALRLAAECASPFHARVTEHMTRAAAGGPSKRVLLDVPFVRQHHMTCVPATLAALSSFWGVRAAHLEVADAICYDGTPHHAQRAWAETHGYVARELTATWDVLRALLDRGVPFTVATVQAANAHLQAVIGYDERRGTLFLRDPFVPQTLEALAEGWLAAWKATGPHAMVLVPEAERAKLDGIELPDAALCDHLHATNAALERHHRDEAIASRDALARAAPGHRLAIAARRAVAAYDQDPEGVLACAREVAEAYPDFTVAHLDALACMRSVRSRDERLAAAETLLAAHPKERMYGEYLARELISDAREHGRARLHLRRAFDARPDRHEPLSLLAEVLASEGRFEEALVFQRFAACLGRFDEGAAYAYFIRAHALGHESEALAFLEGRVRALGERSVAPVQTLFRAYEALGSTEEGVHAIAKALETHDDDGDLLLFAADVHGSIGDITLAHEYLARAEGCTKESHWLRSGALLALREGNHAERRKRLERVLALEPIDGETHVAYARELAASEGLPAARKHLESAWRRFPHVRGLARSYVEWSRASGAAEQERAVRAVIAVDPSDAWLHRELSLALVEQGRRGEARAALVAAAALAPRDASLEACYAVLARREGEVPELMRRLWAILELDPDRADVVAELVTEANDAKERDETLARIERLVRERSVTGQGIVGWYLAARSNLEPVRMGEALERLLAQRPRLWVSHGCAIRQASLVGDHERAIALGRDACARFPLVAGIWIDHADALAAAGKSSEAVTMLERAVTLDLANEVAAGRLAAAVARAGQASRAREVLGRALRHVPTSVVLRLQLGELEWSEGDGARAVRHAEAALALDPDGDRAWSLLDTWSTTLGREAEALRRIEVLCAERPWSATAMLHLARIKGRHDDIDGALDAVRLATERDPRCVDAHDYRAILLAVRGRWTEAEAACAPAAYEGRVPRELMGRAAWLKARQGDLEGACRAMRAILADHPDYPFGWSMLTTWCQQRGATAEVVEAGQRLAKVAPRSPQAHRALGDALLAVGDRTGARRAFARAVDLAPNEETAAWTLFELALEDGAIADAQAMVPVLRAARSAAGKCAQVRLMARQGDAEAATAALRELGLDALADARLMDRAWRACALAGLEEHAGNVLKGLFEEQDAQPVAGSIWARWRCLSKDLDAVGAALKFLSPQSKAAQAAALEWLMLLEEHGTPDARREAARLVKARFPTCDDGLWATVAGALVTCGAAGEAAVWTRDWRSRPKATSWMLLNAASAQREMANDLEALEIVRRAAALPDDGASRSHRAWLAFELATRGEAQEARRWLTQAGELSSVPLLDAVASATNAMLVVQEGGGTLPAFSRARQLLAKVNAQRRFVVIRRAYARASAKVARDVGFPAGTLWASRQSLLKMGVAVAIVAAVVGILVGAAHGGGSTTSSFPMLIWLGIIAYRMVKRGRSS